MAKIIAVVLRSKNTSLTLDFYRDLGVGMNKSQHGNGPVHHELAPISDQFVIEMYPVTANNYHDQLIIEVDDLGAAIQVLEKYGIGITARMTQQKGIKTFDTDGRALIIVEKTEA